MNIRPITSIGFRGGNVKEYNLPNVTKENSHNLEEYNTLTKYTDTDLFIKESDRKFNFYMPREKGYEIGLQKTLEDGTTLECSHLCRLDKNINGEALESEIRPGVYNTYSLLLQDIVNYKNHMPLRHSEIKRA